MKRLLVIMTPLIFSCEKATLLISKREEGKLTFNEKVRLRFHLVLCIMCRSFEKQTATLSKATGKIDAHLHHPHLLPGQKDDIIALLKRND